MPLFVTHYDDPITLTFTDELLHPIVVMERDDGMEINVVRPYAINEPGCIRLGQTHATELARLLAAFGKHRTVRGLLPKPILLAPSRQEMALLVGTVIERIKPTGPNQERERGQVGYYSFHDDGVMVGNQRYKRQAFAETFRNLDGSPIGQVEVPQNNGDGHMILDLTK